METQTYVSCIRINGVPILPPMMTKEVIEETYYYKQLAMAVEKKLAAWHLSIEPHANNSIGKQKRKTKGMRLSGRVFSLDDDIITGRIRNLDPSTSPNLDITSQVPVKPIKLFDCLDKETANFDGDSREGARSKMNSDEDNGFESETRLAASTVSRSTSADLSRGLNETPSYTSDTTPETCKPQVPKTLDIIPLTLDNTVYEKNGKDLERESGNFKEAPKLVRQGSYVLDTPSPMLLAHMQLELTSSANTPDNEYVPTPSKNTIRRTEWNIAQAKMEWEHCENEKETSKHANNNQRGRTLKKTVQEQIKSESFSNYASAKSVDCIQAMLAKEYIDKKRPKTSHEQRHPSYSSSCDKRQKYSRWKNYNLPKKFGGSLGNLNNACTPISKRVEQRDKKDLSNGFGEEEVKRSREEIKESTIKLKSSITTDKLLAVYKEIQRMHQKQMTELVTRQQKEQSVLQKEFEKQQLLLLTEIKKSFPKDSISILSDSTSTADCKAITKGETVLRHSYANASLDETSSIITKPCDAQSPGIERANTISCPLDYIYPKNAIQDVDMHSVTYSSPTQTLEIHSPQERELNERTEMSRPDTKKSDVQNSEWESESQKKCSRVSRQLFPLDSKTVHVPVLDNAVYESKHIRAASIIQAYARGYLVRRIMQTERVIALRNTYKEALHCMLKLHIDAPLDRSEFHFLQRLQLQCDAASMNMVELFAQSPEKRMQIIAQDREIKRSRIERPTSARSYSFATQRTLARKKMKEMGHYQPPSLSRSWSARSRCQTWTSDVKEKLISPNVLRQSIKRSTSAGTVRKPWR